MSNFRKLYDEKIVPELMKEHNYTTVMAVPKLEKIVINMGVGEGSKDEKFITAAVKDLEAISGQKCVVTKALPRVRDFRGVSSKAFDGRGNYSLGIKEQLIFPEIEYDEVLKVRGMDIIFVTTAKSNEEAKSLLKGFGMPFKN